MNQTIATCMYRLGIWLLAVVLAGSLWTASPASAIADAGQLASPAWSCASLSGSGIDPAAACASAAFALPDAPIGTVGRQVAASGFKRSWFIPANATSTPEGNAAKTPSPKATATMSPPTATPPVTPRPRATSTPSAPPRELVGRLGGNQEDLEARVGRKFANIPYEGLSIQMYSTDIMYTYVGAAYEDGRVVLVEGYNSKIFSSADAANFIAWTVDNLAPTDADCDFAGARSTSNGQIFIDCTSAALGRYYGYSGDFTVMTIPDGTNLIVLVGR